MAVTSSRYTKANGKPGSKNRRTPLSSLGQRCGATRIVSMARCISSATALRIAGFRSRYRENAASYSSFASSWNTTGLLVMLKLCGNPSLHFFPRNRLRFSRIQICDPPRNLPIPRFACRSFILGVEALDQRTGKLRTLFFRKRQRLLQQFQSFLRHDRIIRRRLECGSSAALLAA